MVLLDTNALFLPMRTGLDLVVEVERWVAGAELQLPSSVRVELDRLVDRGARHARAARTLAQRFRSVPTDRAGDDGILDAAARLRAVVVTADRRLAERLRAAGVAVLVPRDRARLELRTGVAPRTGRPAARTGPRAAATVKKRPRSESR